MRMAKKLKFLTFDYKIDIALKNVNFQVHVYNSNDLHD